MEIVNEAKGCIMYPKRWVSGKIITARQHPTDAQCARTAVALLGERNEISVDDLPEDFLEQTGPVHGRNTGDSLLAEMEARHISSTLDQTGGNIAEAARKMGIGRNTLYRKLRSMTPTDSKSKIADCNT